MSNNNKTPFEMGKIADQSKRGWTVKVNGEVVEDIEKLEIISERFGTLHYGSNGLYDTWCFDEIGGGGAVVIPYMIHPVTGAIYVGLVQQERPLAGGKVWEIPRGFMNPTDQDKSETALREAIEELGYAPFGEIFSLAQGKNPNSTFFNTSNEGDGVEFFALPVMGSILEPLDDPMFAGTFVFPKHIQDAAKGDGCEKIYGSKFMQIDSIIFGSPDMFTAAALGYLLSVL